MRRTMTGAVALATVLAITLGATAQQPGALPSTAEVQQPQLPAQPGALQTPGATNRSPGSSNQPALPSQPAYVPTPPTPGGPAPARPPVGFYRPPAMSAPGRLPAAPPSTVSSAAPYINPFASAQGMISSVPTSQPNVPVAPSVLADKPFAGYTPPSPVSPYLNLYRSDTDFGAVNNYYTLVRPMVRQQMENERLQEQLRSVENATRIQSQSINQLGERTNYLYGLPSGSPYMNYGGFYPGYQPASPEP